MPRAKKIQRTEEWAEILDFPRYMVSTEGRIFNNATNRYMRTSLNNYGHPKISLLDSQGVRHTLSPAVLVARAFVEPPNIVCDRIIYLNGDTSDFKADNLAWRPRGFVWEYSRQLKIEQPIHYRNLKVINLNTEVEYANIISAGMSEGLLFDHIWRSTYSGSPCFPDGSIWAIEKKGIRSQRIQRM